jgi:tetratricopeptide (TPR) repeat protein
VGLGNTGRGSRIPVVTEEGERRYLTSDGREVYSRLQADTLKGMAGATPGGRYLGVGTGAFDLGQIYRDLILSEDSYAMGEVDIVQYEERFQVFLLAAFLLLLAEAFLRDRRRPPARRQRFGGRARGLAFILLGLTLAVPGARAGGAGETVEEGNAALAADSLQEALNLYEQARELAPEEPVPLYNLGVALYESENYPAALNAFQNMETDRPALAALSHYNQGNTLARLGNELERQEPGQALELYRRSIGAYKRVLAIDPAHDNARRNIEVVRQWIEPLLERQSGSDSDGQQSQQSQDQTREGPQNDSQDGSPSPGDPGEQSPEEGPDTSEEAPEADLDTDNSPAETAQAILEEEEQRRREQAEAAGRRDSGGSPTW